MLEFPNLEERVAVLNRVIDILTVSSQRNRTCKGLQRLDIQLSSTICYRKTKCCRQKNVVCEIRCRQLNATLLTTKPFQREQLKLLTTRF